MIRKLFAVAAMAVFAISTGALTGCASNSSSSKPYSLKGDQVEQDKGVNVNNPWTYGAHGR